MSRYALAPNRYLMPTPAGAYYTVSGVEQEPPRRLLRSLFRRRSSPESTPRELSRLNGADDENQCLELLYRMQQLGWVQGLEQQRYAPRGTLEELLPDLLEPLSSRGRVLMADAQGFYVASRGFPHETAEELSALSADLASLHARHSGLLRHNLGLGTSAWGLVDAAGNSQLGFWPVFIGEQRFVLVIGGLPCFHQPAWVDLVWALSGRYG
jgi:hypothetical protein